MEVIKKGEPFIYDNGQKGYLCIIREKTASFDVLNDSEKRFEDILELDEYNRQNH